MIENLKELFQFRSLLFALVQRHLHVRYRGSSLGFLWSLLNPLCLMAVYTVVFHYYMRAAEQDHYSIFLFVGLLPWLWFISSITEGTVAIISSGHLITKSMFPAHILPVVSVITNLVNYLLALPLLMIFMYAAGVPFHLSLIFVPILVVLQFLFLIGLTLFLGSLNVQFRDVQHLVNNLLTFLFFLCPIVYSAAIIPPAFHITLILNPFALFILSYQDCILHGNFPSLLHVLLLATYTLMALLCGHLVFERYREHFAEAL